MQTTVQIFSRRVYGTLRIYPANDVAQNLAAFKGVKTFENADLDAMRALGYELVTVEDPVAVAMKAAKAKQTAGQ